VISAAAFEAEHQRVAAIKDAWSSRLMSQPGVTGVGVAFKVVNGKTTDTLGVMVTVERKLADISPALRIPPSLDGAVTDVVEFALSPTSAVAESPIADADLQRYDPMLGGIGIAVGPVNAQGHYQCGTLGLVVRVAGAPAMLTCSHVVTGPGVTAASAVYQPIFDPSQPNQVGVVGTQCFRQNFAPNNGPTLFGVDCAAIAVAPGSRGSQTGAIQGLTTTVVGAMTLSGVDLQEGQNAVYSRSYSLGDTWKGSLLSFTYDTWTPNHTLQMMNQILFAAPKWYQRGDSGAVLVRRLSARMNNYVAVGLAWGGDAAHQTGVASPMVPVLGILGATIL